MPSRPLGLLWVYLFSSGSSQLTRLSCGPFSSQGFCLVSAAARRVPLSHSQQTRDVKTVMHGFMLGHRLRRWPNIKPSLFHRLAFAGSLLSHPLQWPTEGCSPFEAVSRPCKSEQLLLFAFALQNQLIHFAACKCILQLWTRSLLPCKGKKILVTV